ncbi:hypothetical protein BIV60_27420 [Bacillus sp. MUM 116]|uniref:hypothetical protein n=1 Tax=Bacillus sp. MUM 116 TaxID=1678002 RepID=UPI0008F5BD86|nr:hypothetical protein [Bacillus sp. MUM 116]OIK06056.1 hypothetical protein BIV60_27420 [Bacillus sp. MUM 116]
MKTKLTTLALILLFVISIAIETQALSFNKLPIKHSSKQWSVEVAEPGHGKELVKSEKGKFNTYSLEIHNIGKDVKSVEVFMYRNEPNSTTKYSLFGCPDGEDCTEGRVEHANFLAKQLNKGIPYRFENFPLAHKATELEVEIIWTQKGKKIGRPLKETFTFAVE